MRVVDNSVILRVGSRSDGARRFPLLARAGAYSWTGFAAVRAAAAPIWLAGRTVSRSANSIRSLQVAGAGGASRLQETFLQTRRKRAGDDATHRSLPTAELDRSGISADAAANLRSAGDAVCARGRPGAESAKHQHCGHATADALRHTDGGTAGAGVGGSRLGGGERHGARNRRHRAPGGDGGKRPRDRGAGYGRGCLLSRGKQETVRESS